MVYLIDDDAGIRSSLTFAFAAQGMALKAYASAEEFLENYDPGEPSCLILDLQLENSLGLNALKKMRNEMKMEIPVIIVTGVADVPSAIASMKLCVREFMEKPVDPNTLIEAVRKALVNDEHRLKQKAEQRDIASRFDKLTARERDLVPLICFGKSNKEMAKDLGVSLKTIANHRANLLAKVGAVNTADFVRMASILRQFSAVPNEWERN